MKEDKNQERQNEDRQQQLAKDLPNQVDNDVERGERIVTGKTIAQGGQAPSDQQHPARKES